MVYFSNATSLMKSIYKRVGEMLDASEDNVEAVYHLSSRAFSASILNTCLHYIVVVCGKSAWDLAIIEMHMKEEVATSIIRMPA